MKLRHLLIFGAAALAAAGMVAADDGDDQAGGGGIPARPETHGSPINNGIDATVEVLVLG